MDAAQFLAVQTAHRLGGFDQFRPSISQTARLQALSVSSGSAMAWDAAQKMPYAVNGWTCRPGAPHRLRNSARGVKVHKSRGAMVSLTEAGADFDVLVDMQDRRVRALNTVEGEVFPTICFNRAAGAPGRILWHMPGPLHEIGSDAFLGPFPDPDAVPFAQRIPRLVWRGGITGRAGNGADIRKEGYRFDRIFDDLGRGKRTLDWAAQQLANFPRFRFVSQLANRNWADVGFIAQPHLHPLSASLMQPLQVPAMPQRAQARHKYIAVLRGADLASSYYWTMNSGSLALVMETPWESFGSAHFLPWHHYVPFREDLSDLDDKLAWCNDHPLECEAMTRAARKVCVMLARADLRIEADKALIAGLRHVLGLA